jgi:hypothetical protein
MAASERKRSIDTKRGWSIIRSLVARSLDLPVESEEVDELAAFVFAAVDGAVILERLDGKPLTLALRPLFELIASRQKRHGGRMSALDTPRNVPDGAFRQKRTPRPLAHPKASFESRFAMAA